VRSRGTNTIFTTLSDICSLEESIVSGLSDLNLDQCKTLTVTQIKKIRLLIDESIETNKSRMDELETARDAVLGEMSNWLHASVPISKDEDADNR
jgi:seryl-tRNA synthetase